MQTSGDGTTDNNLVDGIVEYINGAGLTGEFVVKVYNHPIPFNFRRELAQGEDVLVGISYENGSGGHWLVGRSFNNVINDAGTITTADDYWEVSFVDPYTASVYHTTMRGSYIQYNGQRVRVDILIAVSPTDIPTNDDTAQYVVAENEVWTQSWLPTFNGDFTFALLGDPDPVHSADHRTLPLQADANGHVYLARITLEALREGQVELRFGSRTQGIPPVQLLYIDENSNLAVYQDIDFGDPAARIIVGEVKAQTDLIQTVDPADGVARVQYRIDDVGGQRLASFSSILRFDSTCMEILRVDSDRGGFFSSISGDEVELGATALGGLEAPEQLAGITTRLIGDKDTVCSMELVSGEFVPTSGSPIPAAGSIEEGAIINGSIVFTLVDCVHPE